MEALDLPTTKPMARRNRVDATAVVSGDPGERAICSQLDVSEEKQGGAGEPIKVLVVADNSFTREGAATVLAGDDRLKLVGTVESGRKAIESIAELHPDLVAIQLAILTDEDGIELVTRVAADPEVNSVLFNGTKVPQGDGRLTADAIEALKGADSYLSTDAPSWAIREEILGVGLGASGSPGQLELKGLLQLVERRPTLPDRYRPVLELAAAGHTTATMAEILNYSEATVKNYLSDVRLCLDAKNTTEAVVLAMRLGLIRFEEPEPGEWRR